MGAAPQVELFPDADTLAQQVAARTVTLLAAALDERPLAHLVVTGGSILEAVFVALRDAAEGLDWSRVALWWGDERFVPSDSDDRNDKAAFAKLFSHVQLSPENVHRMPPSDGEWGDNLELAAAAYGAELRLAALTDDPSSEYGAPRFDVILLGMGPDGHCASLFPGAPGVYELDTAVIAVSNSPKPPPNRISLTFTGLGCAEQIWVIASGTGKAEAVGAALDGAARIQIPVAGAQGRRRTLWLLDRDAALNVPAELL